MYVEDHAEAGDLIYHKGKNSETYNIGGFNEWTNIDLIKVMCLKMDEILGKRELQNNLLLMSKIGRVMIKDMY